jgi:MraZ protein
LFRGAINLNLDAKGRLQIPAKHRDRLRESVGGRLVVTLDPQGHCLWLYPEDEWSDVEHKLMKLPSINSLRRLLLGSAHDVEMDSQGRILLPVDLRENASLQKRVSIVGQGTRFEIWDETRWTGSRVEWIEQTRDSQSEMAEQLQNLVL